MRALLDLVAPIRCLGCGAGSDGELCLRCAEDIRVISAPMCERCGAPGPSALGPCSLCRDLAGFARARSLVAYADPTRRLTLALKRRGRAGLADAVGSLLADLAAIHRLDADAVTFVPGGANARRLGFDHAELIARAVARELGRPLRRVVFRIAHGPRQADVPLRDRRRNARGRFGARPTAGRVLLVDDVFTTGATVEACALALRAAGASSVGVVTWARTLRRSPTSS